MENQLPRFPGPLASRGLRLKPGPCHFGYEVGDEIIYDGENFIGRICLQIIPLLNKYVPPLYSVGPRYVNPFSYFPFFYSPLSTKNAAQRNTTASGSES